MVLIRRNEGHRRAYIAVARAGLILFCGLLVAAASPSTQHVATNANATATHANQDAQAVPNRPASPVVIEVEPSAQAVDAVAEQQAYNSRIMGYPPDDWVAWFTGAVAISTIFLWFATYKSAGAATRAAVIAERALVDLERPYIFIFGITRITNAIHTEGNLEYPIVRCDISNSGRSPAIIAKANYFIEWSSTVPPTTENVPNLRNLNDLDVLAIGERRVAVEIDLSCIKDSLEGYCGGEDYESRKHFDSWMPKNRPSDDIMFLFLRVMISYSGPFSRNHETSICCWYDIGESCFRAQTHNQ